MGFFCVYDILYTILSHTCELTSNSIVCMPLDVSTIAALEVQFSGIVRDYRGKSMPDSSKKPPAPPAPPAPQPTPKREHANDGFTRQDSNPAVRDSRVPPPPPPKK
jgi:hypothetical protein